jgi:hypothetical protein
MVRFKPASAGMDYPTLYAAMASVVNNFALSFSVNMLSI